LYYERESGYQQARNSLMRGRLATDHAGLIDPANGGAVAPVSATGLSLGPLVQTPHASLDGWAAVSHLKILPRLPSVICTGLASGWAKHVNA
jgi:hypothetical protein